MTAQRIWVLCMAWRKLLSVSWWYSCVPCEKLNRATFIPALSNFSSIGTDLDAGPIVHTIFVFGFLSSCGTSFSIPSMSMFAISQKPNKKGKENSPQNLHKSGERFEKWELDLKRIRNAYLDRRKPRVDLTCLYSCMAWGRGRARSFSFSSFSLFSLAFPLLKEKRKSLGWLTCHWRAKILLYLFSLGWWAPSTVTGFVRNVPGRGLYGVLASGENLEYYQ